VKRLHRRETRFALRKERHFMLVLVACCLDKFRQEWANRDVC